MTLWCWGACWIKPKYILIILHRKLIPWGILHLHFASSHFQVYDFFHSVFHQLFILIMLAKSWLSIIHLVLSSSASECEYGGTCQVSEFVFHKNRKQTSKQSNISQNEELFFHHTRSLMNTLKWEKIYWSIILWNQYSFYLTSAIGKLDFQSQTAI